MVKTGDVGNGWRHSRPDCRPHQAHHHHLGRQEHLTLRDRKQPQDIAYVKEARVYWRRRKFLTALVGIELDTVGDWALRQGIPYTTYRDLGEKSEVLELIQGVVNETNEKFPSSRPSRSSGCFPKGKLDHEDGELTATQKIKRNSMEEMFGELIEEMY
ncbi:MAG: hypothetical protein Ct9H300mP12_12230 [Acidimicrobiales bacterium]|nr:MAG: hypothetical protein Ct9H300mP12_12230 [Acidimicrobiales bacterium]